MNTMIPFSVSTLMPFLPMLIISLTVMVVMIAIALRRSNFMAATLSVVGLNTALLVLILQFMNNQAMTQHKSAVVAFLTPSAGLLSSLFIVDGFAQVNMLIILVSALACFTLAYAYIEGYKGHKEELYILMLIATLGAMLMVCSDHFASFFISLELLSVPMYGMLAYTYIRGQSLEAGLKYLVLSATASATMLMGMALVYAYTGTLAFHSITEIIFAQLPHGIATPLIVVGSALIVFGVAFKLSAVPFHTWTPDVYQGAPAPVATFLASVGKVAMLALGLRFLITTGVLAIPAIHTLITVIAVLSMIVGNLLALRQTNIKRMLGYSSIGHLGYVLAIIATTQLGTGILADTFTTLYMAVYAFTTIGAFGAVTLMSSPFKYSKGENTGEADDISHYRGLFWHRPVLTAVLTVMMLSLAGIPLTAGFISKFFAILATVRAGSWLLAAAIILGSAISLYYYLHFMLNLFKRPQDNQTHDAVNHWGFQAGGIMVILVSLSVLAFGIFPDYLIALTSYAKIQ